MRMSALRNSVRGRGPTTDDALVTRLLKRLRSGSDMRRGKVRRVKSALQRGEYVNALKLDVAADRLACEMACDTSPGPVMRAR